MIIDLKKLKKVLNELVDVMQKNKLSDHDIFYVTSELSMLVKKSKEERLDKASHLVLLDAMSRVATQKSKKK